MKQDLDLDAGTRRALVRLVDEIDVDAPLPVDEPGAAWHRPMVTVAAGLVLVSAGAVAVAVSGRGPEPTTESTTTESPTRELTTEEVLWSAGPATDDGACPPGEPPGASCSTVAYVRRDGHLVVTGSQSGPAALDPQILRLRYAVDGVLDEIDIDVVPDDGGAAREWSADVPEQVPELIDEATSGVAVDFFELTALDQDGTVLWTYAAYAGVPPEVS